MRDAAIDTHRSPARGAARARTSGAPLLDDMAGEGPVGRAAPRRGGITSAAIAAQRLGGGRAAARGKRGPGLAARLRARLPRVRPLKVVTVAAFGVALVGIVANAMVFQRGHHPSPLFGLGRSVDGSSDAAARTAAAVPAPPPPVPVEKTGTIAPAPAPAAPVDPAPPATAAVAAPKAAPVHHAAAKVHHEEAAKPKAADKPAEAAAAHPRPGHPAAAHAAAAPKAAAEAAPKTAAKAEAKPDPVAKLLAASSHPAKPDGAHPPKAAGEPAPHPHHRLAAGTPAAGAKPAAEAE